LPLRISSGIKYLDKSSSVSPVWRNRYNPAICSCAISLASGWKVKM
jgi:hypothetical protein